MSDQEATWPTAEHGAMKGCPTVRGRCPSCGNETLALGSGGYITCANLRCHLPTIVSDALERGPGWLDQWWIDSRAALAVVRKADR
jgi:predicted CxxxxCH...CXXCH cytochrome family protein